LDYPCTTSGWKLPTGENSSHVPRSGGKFDSYFKGHLMKSHRTDVI